MTHHLHIYCCMISFDTDTQIFTSLNLLHQIFKINCAKIYSFVSHHFVPNSFYRLRCWTRGRRKKTTTTMKINSICRICFTRAQSAVSSHSPEEKKKVAHTHNILKYTSSFGQNGICYWKLCHEKLFSKFRIALFPTGWLSACVLVRVCTTVAAFWMIDPEPCVFKVEFYK